MLKGRYIRRLAAIASFALCALAVILWIRSYRWSDAASICYASGQSRTISGQRIPVNRFLSATTAPDVLAFHYEPAFILPPMLSLRPARTGIDFYSSEVTDEWWWDDERMFSFAYKTRPLGGLTVAVPFWFLTLLAAAAGALLWKDRPYRFTLRGALVATTFVAIVLGLGAALSR